jgi:hypothetical protein
MKEKRIILLHSNTQERVFIIIDKMKKFKREKVCRTESFLGDQPEGRNVWGRHLEGLPRLPIRSSR